MSGEPRLPDSVQTALAALAFWATATPDAVVLLSPDQEPMTFRMLDETVERLASALRRRGLGREDGIGVLMSDGLDFHLALLAALSVGIAIPLSWPLSAWEVQRIAATGRLRVILRSADTAEPSVADAPTIPSIVLTRPPRGRGATVAAEGPRLGDPRPASAPNPDHFALILHSSGASGRPKLVPRRHQATLAAGRAIAVRRSILGDDCCLVLAKAAFSQGVNALMTTLASGGRMIGIAAPDIRAMPRWIAAYRPTFITTTPAVVRALAAGPDELRRAVRASPLKQIHSSAGPLSSTETGRLEATLGVPILNGYGMSEAPLIAGQCFPFEPRSPGAVGPLWCEANILDENGRFGGVHETGEIVVRGERVFPGYLDDPDANAAAFLLGGWFRTGDLGYLDAAGNLHVTGRRSEVINRGGEKIVPDEIDEMLRAHPGVADAAVFAVADPALGEDMAAAVVGKPGVLLTPRELRGWLLDRAGISRTPRRIWIVECLPRTPTGKVQRGELARRWMERQG